MLAASLLGTMVAGLGQRTTSAPHIITALRREALPEAAGGVGYAGQEDESNEEGLEHE